VAVRIADLPGPEQPRKRVIRMGVSALSDRELLALVIRSGGRGSNAVDVGGKLLATWGSLAALAAARYEDLIRVEALGEAKTASLLAAFELGRRATLRAESRQPVDGPQDLGDLVSPILLTRPQEQVLLIVLNSANKPIRIVELSKGGADRCLLTVRDALSAVLRNDGVAFALAHNHPSGDPTPSPEDIRSTRDIEMAAVGLGLRLLDHVIVAGAGWLSMRDSGFLKA
jgi:DNA repair protein RadC